MGSYHRVWFFSALMLIFLIICLGLADSKSFTVCKDGCDFPSVRRAVEASDPGDLVEVQSGIYHENVRLNKSLSLIGKDTGKGKPIIDAGRNGSAISILADGVTLIGFNLTNAYGSRADFFAGIRIWANDSIIKDNQACYNENGIYITKSLNSSLENNELAGNRYGLRIETSENVSAFENRMKDNSYGLLMLSSEGNILRSNIAEDNDYGIQLNDSENNTLIDNLMRGNSYNFGADGTNNISSRNLVDGRPVLYLTGMKNETIDSSMDVGTIYCLNCENVTIRGLNLSNNFYGISLYNSTASVVEGNDLNNMVIGISLTDSYGNFIRGNQVKQSQADGLQLIDSDANHVDNNYIEDYGRGLFVLRSGYNEILRNMFLNGSIGAYLDSSWNNWLFENFISINSVGLKTASTERNNISMNNMTNNSLDIIRKEFDNDNLEWAENKSIKEKILSESTAGGTGPKKKVEITSYPENAAVLIDGKPANWRTPGEAIFTKPGKYELELRLGQKRISSEIVVPKEGNPEPVFLDFNYTE